MVSKILFAPNSPIFRKSLDEGKKKLSRQLQDVMLYKQTQKSSNLVGKNQIQDNLHKTMKDKFTKTATLNLIMF